MGRLTLLAVLVAGIVYNGHNVLAQQCSTDKQAVDIEMTGANVILGGLFGIHSTGSDQNSCGQIETGMMQVFEAAKYTLNVLNDFTNGYAPGITFGMKAFDTCYYQSQAVNAFQRLFPQTTSAAAYCVQDQQKVSPGVVGPMSSWAALPVARLAGQLGTSLVSPMAASPALSDQLLYPTFLRTVPTNTVFAKAVVEFLLDLQWENVLVVYVNDEYARSGYQQLLDAAYARGLCVADALMLDSNIDVNNYRTTLQGVGTNDYTAAVLVASDAHARVVLQALDQVQVLAKTQWILSDFDITRDSSALRRLRGANVVLPKSELVDEFRTYFTNLEAAPQSNTENPWFEEWYEAAYKCSLTGPANRCPTQNAGQLRNNFKQSPWVVPTMKAVVAYAETVRRICQNAGSGLCSRLRTISMTEFYSELAGLDFTFPNNFPIQALRGERIKFDANGDPENSEFTVYNYNNRQGTYLFEAIGQYELDTLTLSRQPTLYDSSRNTILATNPTAVCATLGCQGCLLPQTTVQFRYTGGDVVIASLVSGHEQGRAPFTCGMGQVSRLLSLVAAEWAVRQYKQDFPNRLRQVSLGSLVADVCPDSSVSQSFLTDLLSGNNRLVDSSGAVVPATNIKAFVDDTSNMQAKRLSPILSQYKIPEIQVGATTPDIMNGGMTPYFSRAIPNDHMFYTAIASMIQRMTDWRYVQVVTHARGEFHKKAQLFITAAANYGVCVVNTATHFSNEDANRYADALDELLGHNEARVVVVIGDADDVRGFLTAVKDKNANGQLQLILGTDRWPMYTRNMQGLESAAEGSIVLNKEMNLNNDFVQYLTSLTRTQIAADPFVKELFETHNRCSLDSSSRNIYDRVCSNNDDVSVHAGASSYVIQSIYTIADKVHEVIAEVCEDPNYEGLCAQFRAAPDIGHRLDMKLQNTAKTNGFGIKNGESTTNIEFYIYRSSSFSKVGEFNTETKQMVNMNGNLLPAAGSVTSVCSGVCTQCQYMYALQKGLYTPGDWLVVGAFSVSNPGPEDLQPYVCGDVRTTNGPQYTMAMAYALNQVNKGAAPVSAAGVKFGGLILDHCNNPGRTNLMVSDIYSGFFNNIGLYPDKVLAVMTDNTASTVEAAHLLDDLGVAMVSPSATSASLMKYPTFHRTIQGDTAAATALVKIVKSLEFNYIQVVYANNAYGKGGLATVDAVSQAEGVCISNSIVLADRSNASNVVDQLVAAETHVVILFMGTADTRALLTAISNNRVARSNLLILMPEPYTDIVNSVSAQLQHPVLSLELQKSTIASYNDYINNSPTSNPYFAQYYMSVFNCNLPGYSSYTTNCREPLQAITSSGRYKEDNFILSTINAVYAVVDTLDRTIKEYCGPNYVTPCSSFMADPDKRVRFNQNLNSANFIDEGKKNFRFLEREGNTVFNILQSRNSGGYTTVGSYAGVSLALTDINLATYASVESKCTAPCLDCVMRGLTFSHTPGDIYLAGMFDVHSAHLSPFTCGRINTLHGFLLLEAFHYALGQVNSKRGPFANILKGTTLGGIGLDACESKVRGGHLVSNIHNHLTTLARDGRVITADNIDLYVGSYSSTSSIYLAKILTDLEIPQISYASNSEELSDDRIFPYFYRSVPSGKSQVEAILRFLDENDIRYIQIVYEDNSFGRTNKDTLLKMAVKYRICVAQAVAYDDLNYVSADMSNTIVAQLVEKPAANTVVSFLATSFVQSLLQAVDRSDRARDKLRFVGSDDWADNMDAILNTNEQAVDSITLKMDADDVKDFERYINSRTLANSQENPWYEEYYQEIHNCYTSKANPLNYPAPCPLTLANTINSPRYQQDPGVLFVLNAVYAAAYALDETLKEKCGPDYSGVCQAYLANKDRRAALRDNLADVRFMDPVGNPFMFVNRSGVAGYRFNSIDRGALGGVTYNQIGLFNVTTGVLLVNEDYTSSWDSNCNREDACAECPNIRDNSVRYAFYKGTPNIPEDGTTIIAFFDIHKQGVDPYRCGEINPEGFQQFVSFFYSAEQLLRSVLAGQPTANSPSTGIRLLAIDTCSNSLRVDQDLFGLLQGSGLCNSPFDDDVPISIGNIGGVVTVGNLNTQAAARVLENLGITYVSPNALGPVLDDKMHLARTIAPVTAVMHTVAHLINAFGWTYVDVMYEDSGWGAHSWNSFDYYVRNQAKICRGSNLLVAHDVTDTELTNLLLQLSGPTGSRVVVLIGSYRFAHRVMKAAGDMSLLDDYIWLLAVDMDLTHDHLSQLVGDNIDFRIITVNRLTDQVESFDVYMQALDYNRVHNPNSQISIPVDWYDEFYQTTFGCTLSSSAKPINIDKAECNTATLRFTPEVLKQNKYVLNTVLAAYSLSSGIRQFLDECGSNCNVGKPLHTPNTRMKIRHNTLGVDWVLADPVPGEINFELVHKHDLRLMFDPHWRWWNPGFEIRYFHGKMTAQKPNNYQNRLLHRGMLNASDPDTVKELRMAVNVSSVCLQTPSQGACGCFFEPIAEAKPQARKGFQPGSHRNYYEYESDGKKKYDWPIWAIVVAALTTLGLAITVILFLILLFAYPKKGGTSVLGYLNIVGILGIYAINFAFFLHADEATCGARRFMMGVVYMIAFAPMLIKAIDNWRYSHTDEVKQRYKGISSACSLFLVAVGIVLIQCIVPIMWLILVHPTASYQAYGYRHDNWWCDPPDDYDLGLVLSFIFVMFVVLVTAIFSALAYDTERNNFESRWTLFGCVATAGCFLVWMIVTTNAAAIYRDPAVAIANFVNATLLLMVLPFRKTVLMCKAMRNKDEKEEPIDGVDSGDNYIYSNSYDNPSFELVDYDSQFAKPSEF